LKTIDNIEQLVRYGVLDKFIEFFFTDELTILQLALAGTLNILTSNKNDFWFINKSMILEKIEEFEILNQLEKLSHHQNFRTRTLARNIINLIIIRLLLEGVPRDYKNFTFLKNCYDFLFLIKFIDKKKKIFGKIF